MRTRHIPGIHILSVFTLQNYCFIAIMAFTNGIYTCRCKEVWTMKRLWTYIEGKDWRTATKYIFASLILGTVFALAGLAVWLIIRNWAFSTWGWMVCFTGFPIIFAWVYVFLYECSHKGFSSPSKLDSNFSHPT